MVDLVLLYPYHPVRVKYCQSIPSLMSYLQHQGHSVMHITGDSNIRLVWKLKQLKPSYVGISVPFTYLSPSAHELIRLIHMHTSCKVVVGGVHVQVCPGEFRDADYVCRGDGEHFLSQLLNGETPWCQQLPLDDLPLPAFHWSDLVPLPNGELALPYQSSRGCPFNCWFCSNNTLSGGRVRVKSTQRIHQDMLHYQHLGVSCFEFRDETFTLNPRRVMQICEVLRRFNIRWWCQTRGNLLSDELVETMQQSGCVGVSVGVESGNQHILNYMQKNILLSQVKTTFELLHSFGLQTYAGFMVGHPWETVDTIVDSMWFADQISPTFLGVTVTMPFPGTQYYHLARRSGGLHTSDFSRYHSGCVFYTPPQLGGVDLAGVKHRFEQWYHSRSYRRLRVVAGRLLRQPGWKPKLRAFETIGGCLMHRHQGVMC